MTIFAYDGKAELIPSLCAGTEVDIVNAARRSFDQGNRETLDNKDIRLIDFLVREGHWLPFRHVQLSFSCDAPVFMARQLGKHQVGLSWSEVSRRYKTEGIQFWVPQKLRQAPENAKQGTGPDLDDDEDMRALMALHMQVSKRLYDELLEANVTPEQARAILPQSMIVSWTWTGSLLAWLHLIRERGPSESHTQTETMQWVRRYIVPVIALRFPHTWESITTHLSVDIPYEQANG